MNRLQGVISQVQTDGHLTILKVQVKDQILSSILIDSPVTNPILKIGAPIAAIFKETEVIIGRGDVSNISLRNKIKGRVDQIESGQLLARLSIQTNIGVINSVITAQAVKNLNISVGDEVWAMIKTNEVMVSQ